METKGRTAVITGGASGIGAVLAEAMVADGGRVVIVDINKDAAEAHAARLGDAALAIACNVADGPRSLLLDILRRGAEKLWI